MRGSINSLADACHVSKFLETYVTNRQSCWVLIGIPYLSVLPWLEADHHYFLSCLQQGAEAQHIVYTEHKSKP